MIEPEFERLSRQIGLTFYDIAFDLTERGVVHAESSPRQPRDGCLLTIKKSGSPLEQAGGSFAVKNDPGPATVQIEIADTRIAAGQPRVEQIPAAEITTDTIRERIRRFVDEWLAE